MPKLAITPTAVATVAVLAFLLAATAGVAAAETLLTEGRTALRARPGEQARIVVRVDADQPVRVIEREGRWIKVEHEGKQGWVTRTSVRSGEDEARAERQRRQRRERQRARAREARRADERERRSGFGRRDADDEGMQVAVIAEKARVFEKRDRSGDEVFSVERGDELRVVARRDDWFRVRAPQGEGWIPEGAVGDHEALERARETAEAQAEAGDEPKPVSDEVLAEADGESLAPRAADPSDESARKYDLRVGLGAAATSIGLDYAADPSASASGFASGVALSGAAHYPLGESVHLGADIRYLAQMGLSGLSYDAGDADLEGSNFFLYELDLGARAGYAITDALGAYLRLGVYYHALYVRDLDNEARLPREELAGLTGGLGVDTSIGESISADLSVISMLAGGHSQTSGLEDGDDRDGMSSLWVSMGMLYGLSEETAVELRYRFGRHRTDWEGASARAPGETDASRTDLTHQFIVGYAAWF